MPLALLPAPPESKSYLQLWSRFLNCSTCFCNFILQLFYRPYSQKRVLDERHYEGSFLQSTLWSLFKNSFCFYSGNAAVKWIVLIFVCVVIADFIQSLLYFKLCAFHSSQLMLRSDRLSRIRLDSIVIVHNSASMHIIFQIQK